MQKFRFRLEKVLRLREQEETLAVQRLHTVWEQLRAAKASKKALELERDRLLAHNRRLLEQRPLNTVALSRNAKYAGLLQARMETAVETVARCEAEVERHRSLVVEAQRRRKALEKLRESELRSWQADNQRQVQRELDELGSSRWRDSG